MGRKRAVKRSKKGPPSKIKNKKMEIINKEDSSSSSESYIENYLQPADKIDLNSPFFNTSTPNSSLSQTEKSIFSENDKLSEEDAEPVASTSKYNFEQLDEYTREMEKAKKHVEEYKKKKGTAKSTDILDMLAKGESQMKEKAGPQLSFNSSDFLESSDSDEERWEEVTDEQQEESLIPKDKDLQITIELPQAIRKKKKIDLMAVIKRRFNRIKKDNQVLIHKVHLLCWIAHGNYVNSLLNSKIILSLVLSLLPLYAFLPKYTNLRYIKDMLEWYKDNMRILEKAPPKDENLSNLLEEQIANRKAYNKKMFVFIFVALMRCLGIQSRLVMSFQVEPLRPPDRELCSLSTKIRKKGKLKDVTDEEESKKSGRTEKSNSKIETVVKNPENITKKTNRKRQNTKTSLVEGEVRRTRSMTAKEKNQNNSSENVDLEQNTERKDNKNKTSKKPRTRSKSNAKSKGASSKTNVKNKKKSAPKSKSPRDLSSMTAKEKNRNNARDNLDKMSTSGLERKKSEKESNKSQTRSKKNIPSHRAKNKGTGSKTNTKNKEKPKSPKDLRNLIKIKLITKKESVKKTARSRKTKTSIPQVDGANDSDSEAEVISKPNLRKRKSNDSKKSSSILNPYVSLIRLEDIPKLDKSSKPQDHKSSIETQKSSSSDDSDDSDYMPGKKRHRDDDDDDYYIPSFKTRQGLSDYNKHDGIDVWAEIFLETEKKWISINVVKARIDCVDDLYMQATHPISYVVAWNNDGTLKDVTARYCRDFNTITRKLRVNSKWWEATLKPFTGSKIYRDVEEDNELEKRQLERPLPTTISEYKNHPLYALKRHLLKYEAIYPPDAPTLGFVKGEAVYSRQCVYTLHPRDTWLKHAKVVKPGETPYKIVRGKPRWDRPTRSIVTDDSMDIFGPWQVEDYEPPTAENGIVPRNAYGNVDLYRQSMLPRKTVLLKHRGIGRIARRMKIDCAQAFVGFDHTKGRLHRVFSGYVVCEEYADALVAAWKLEQEELEKKEKEKVEKRVYENWKRLIKGLLIQERLKTRYKFTKTNKESIKGKQIKKKRLQDKE